MRVLAVVAALTLAVAAPAAGAPSLASSGCPLFPADNVWHADVSRLPVHPRSAAYVASIGTAAGHARRLRLRHLRRRADRHPVHGRAGRPGRGEGRVSTTPARATGGRTRSRPDAPSRAARGADGDRHVSARPVRRAGRTSCTTPTATVTAPGGPVRGRCSTCGPTAATGAAGPRPTPPGCRSWPGWSATRRWPGPDRPCDPGHRRPEPGQLPVAGPPPGRAGRRVAAADGPAAAAEGQCRHRRLPRPGQGDPAGHADLWADRGRQRLVGVHRRCARRALGQRRPPPARAGHPGRLRGRRHRPAADLPASAAFRGAPRAGPARPARPPPAGPGSAPALLPGVGRRSFLPEPQFPPASAAATPANPALDAGAAAARADGPLGLGSPALLPQILAAILGVSPPPWPSARSPCTPAAAATPLPAATLRGVATPAPAPGPARTKLARSRPARHQVPPDPDPAGSRRP